MIEYKIVHDRPNCIGCAACAAVSPEHWEMNSDGKSDLKNSKDVGTNQEKEIEEGQFKTNKEAADSCPVNVIHLFDKSGKKLI